MESDTFLIGEVEPHVARLLGNQDVITFPTLREFDRWRYENRFSNAPATIERLTSVRNQVNYYFAT